MAADAPIAASAGGAAPIPVPDRKDARWLISLWIVLSIIGCYLVAMVWPVYQTSFSAYCSMKAVSDCD